VAFLRRLGWMLARLVALAVVLVSAWMLIINLVELDYDDWVLAWILLSGIVGAVGGSLFLLSIDGPDGFRTNVRRRLGWASMLIAMLLPTSLSFFLLPMVAVLIPTIFNVESPGGEVVTSS
jgi:hypothetical protein